MAKRNNDKKKPSWMSFEKKEEKEKEGKARESTIISIRLPRDLKELMQWIMQVTPLVRSFKYIFACIFILIVLGMKDTITAMEFEPTTAGLMIWVMLMLLALQMGFSR